MSEPQTHAAVIGFGQVGQALTYLLSAKRIPLHVNVIDPEINLGAFEDISHAFQGGGHSLHCNCEESLPLAEVVFHCAGPSIPPGATRLSVASKSLQLTEKIFFETNLQDNEPLIVVVANPVDLVTLKTWQVCGLPPEKVIGTGTLLDTRRFNCFLERRLKLPTGSAQAVLLGEHGSSMMVWTGGSKLSGRPLLEMVSEELVSEVLHETKSAAAFIKKHQGATYYGVSHCAVTLWQLYHENRQSVVPATTLIRQELGTDWNEEPYFMSAPILIGNDTLEVLTPEYNERDLTGLRNSANALYAAWPGRSVTAKPHQKYPSPILKTN